MFEDYRNPNDYWMQNNKDGNDEMYEQGCLTTILYIVIFVVAILLCALMSGCKSVEYVFVPEHHTDTLIQTKVVHDSIHVKDSTSIERKDSIIKIEHWHTKYVEKQVHDTTYVSKTDTVPQPYTVIEYVEKPRSTFEKILIGVGLLTVLSLIVFIVWKIKGFLPGM